MKIHDKKLFKLQTKLNRAQSRLKLMQNCHHEYDLHLKKSSPVIKGNDMDLISYLKSKNGK